MGPTFLILNEAAGSVWLTPKSQQLLWLWEKGLPYHRGRGGICIFMRARTFTFRLLEIRKNKSLVVITTLSNVFCGSDPIRKGKLFPFHQLFGEQRFACFNCYRMCVLIAIWVIFAQRKYTSKVIFFWLSVTMTIFKWISMQKVFSNLLHCAGELLAVLWTSYELEKYSLYWHANELTKQPICFRDLHNLIPKATLN